MNWCFELACKSAPDRAAAARSWLEGLPWRRLPGLSAVDLYVPAAGDAHDPFNHDGAGPLLAMLAFASRDALAAAVTDQAFARALAEGPAGMSLTGTAFERRFYPVEGEAAPSPLTAPFSYVVRYHRPAEDEQAFIGNYVATHPETLAKLPGIRSVMCYFRLADDVTAAGVNPAEYMIGNEVAFDSIDAFNVAMQSPVRQELRQHFREFPAFTGLNTHFPMQRTRLAA